MIAEELIICISIDGTSTLANIFGQHFQFINQVFGLQQILVSLRHLEVAFLHVRRLRGNTVLQFSVKA